MKFDAIVIGSGQGGNPLAHKLADLKWNVALVERHYLGGTCINTGCTPTKTMIASAQIAHYARNAARWGVQARDVRVDLPAVVARKQKIVETFRAGQQQQVDKRPTLRLVRGHARFTAAHQIQVGTEILESEKIFIDTGARPFIPPIPAIETVSYLTNTTIMELQEIPQHLIVLGGGYIGLEFGQMFRRLGSQVTIIHNGGQIIAREDVEIAQGLQQALEAEDIVFHLNAETTRVCNRGKSIAVAISTKHASMELAGSHLLAATGRKPNTDDLGLEAAGVKLDGKGYVHVNGRLETNVPGIWALGDVKGGPAFTHISYNDYQIIWGNLIEGKDLSIDNRYVPYALFTDPPLGRVGITEKEARESGRKFKMGTLPMANVSRAIERGETEGLMKILVDAQDNRILGAAIFGIEGGETVQILGAMMLAGAPYTVLKGAVFIHPTLAEGLFGLLESVKDA